MLDETDIRGWVERNAVVLLPDARFTSEEIDHIAMCLHHIYRWYNEGYPIGGFLSAIVRNDFLGTCLRADSVNQRALYLYALFCANKIGVDYQDKANSTKPKVEKISA